MPAKKNTAGLLHQDFFFFQLRPSRFTSGIGCPLLCIDVSDWPVHQHPREGGSLGYCLHKRRPTNKWRGSSGLHTYESNLVQSSWSSSEQYIGLCPMVMIHGRTALFSGLLASWVRDTHTFLRVCQIERRGQRWLLIFVSLYQKSRLKINRND